MTRRSKDRVLFFSGIAALILSIAVLALSELNIAEWVFIGVGLGMILVGFELIFLCFRSEQKQDRENVRACSETFGNIGETEIDELLKYTFLPSEDVPFRVFFSPDEKARIVFINPPDEPDTVYVYWQEAVKYPFETACKYGAFGDWQMTNIVIRGGALDDVIAKEVPDTFKEETPPPRERTRVIRVIRHKNLFGRLHKAHVVVDGIDTILKNNCACEIDVDHRPHFVRINGSNYIIGASECDANFIIEPYLTGVTDKEGWKWRIVRVNNNGDRIGPASSEEIFGI